MIETSGAAQARDCANLARFLAFTDCRIAEAKQAVWGDVNWQDNTLQIHSVKVRGSHDGSVTRMLPMNPALRQLLEKLSDGKEQEPSSHICKVFECQKSLDRACKLAGCKRLVQRVRKRREPFGVMDIRRGKNAIYRLLICEEKTRNHC